MAKAVGFNVFERQRGLHLKLPTTGPPATSVALEKGSFALLRKT